MASVYADQVEAYGQRWHRPWLVFVVCLALIWGFNLLARPTRERVIQQIRCEPVAGSRYRASVELDGLVWTADMDAALACALKQNRRVLVAFHAMTDVNARVNEQSAFRDQRVRSTMRRYVLVMLHIDSVPAHFYRQTPDPEERQKDGEANLNFELQKFDTREEPMYAILQPKGQGNFDIVARFGGLIKDTTPFIDFLQTH